MKWLLAAALGAAALLAQAQPAASARETAMRVVELLAAGDVEGVAQLSNAPDRRREVLQAYKARIGEEEFRRIFGRYREVPIVQEVALGEHRMIIRRLPEPEGRLAAQYFVQVNGRFFIDDVPSEARERLRGALQRYRQASPAANPSERRD